MPTTQVGTAGDYIVTGPQGIQALFDIIEQRLEALEQAVMGGAYVKQQVNLGTVSTRSTRVLPGPGSNTQTGAIPGR